MGGSDCGKRRADYSLPGNWIAAGTGGPGRSILAYVAVPVRQFILFHWVGFGVDQAFAYRTWMR